MEELLTNTKEELGSLLNRSPARAVVRILGLYCDKAAAAEEKACQVARGFWLGTAWLSERLEWFAQGSGFGGERAFRRQKSGWTSSS